MIHDKPSGIWPLTLEVAREKAKKKRLDASTHKVEIVSIYIDRGPPIDEPPPPTLKEIA